MKTLLVLTLGAALPAGPALALGLRAYAPARHDRFTGFPAAPVANPAFMHAGLDLTGVGWDSTHPVRQFTLISPLHFVGANHFRPPIGAEIRFLSSGGILRGAVVQSLFTIPNASGQPTDLLVGRLASPILPSSHVKFLPYHNLDSEAAYVGQTLAVLGMPGRGGRGLINSIADFGGDPITGGSGVNTTRTARFSYAFLTGSPDDAFAEPGDSGSPSLVAVNGKAALVGTHTAVLTALGTTTTFDSFLPAYVAPVNGVMEADGYHLTAATPKSTTLTLSQQPGAGVWRAGYPVTLTLTLTNNGTSFAANNVRLDASLPAVSGLSAADSPGWVTVNSNGAAQSRRGGLPAGAASQIMLTFTPPAPGLIQSSATYTADEAAAATQDATFTVIESFKSWSAGLINPSPHADDDRDGTDNLLEYAEGGDPRISSRTVSGSTVEMGLGGVRTEFASGGLRQVIRYVRRTDAEQRLLAYYVEVSSTLAGPWDDVSVASTLLSVTPVVAGFESVELALPATAASRQFARLRVGLSE